MTAGRSRSGRGRSASASRPASTSAARVPGGCRLPSSATTPTPRTPRPTRPAAKEVCLDKGEVTDREWSLGDNVNLAIGQGDVQVDPLQMAVAYAAIANGGDIVRPHVGLRVDDPQGRAIQEIDPAVRDHIEIDPAAQRTIMDGLHGAAMEPERHLLPGLRRLPGRYRRQDGHGGDRPGRPVLVHRARPVRRPQVRGRGDDRARRLRRRHRRPRRAADPRRAPERRSGEHRAGRRRIGGGRVRRSEAKPRRREEPV